MAVQIQNFGYQVAVHANAGTSKKPKYLPNIDGFYGPYESKEAAYANLLTDPYQICVGKTVSVIEDGKLIEYWFESACASIDDLVLKGTAVEDLTEDQMSALLAIISPSE